MMTGGSVYVDDQWLFIGPTHLLFEVPIGRLRLNAFGPQVYLGRTVGILIEAGLNLEREIEGGQLRPRGVAGERRGADLVYEGFLEAVINIGESAESG